MADEETNRPAGESGRSAKNSGMVPGYNPRVGKTLFSADGMMEGSGGWSREEMEAGRSGFDETESLQELAARVMAAQSAADEAQTAAEAAQAEVASAESELTSAQTEYASRVQEIRANFLALPIEETPISATTADDEKERRRRSIAAIAGICALLLVGTGLGWFILGGGSSSPAGEGPAQAAAVVPTGTATPPAEVAAVPVDDTTPGEQAVVPADPSPADPPPATDPPAAEPVATPAPTPAPTPVPVVMHIAKMEAPPKDNNGNNRLVLVYIKDASNNPVTDAAVAGRWRIGGKDYTAICWKTDSGGLCQFPRTVSPGSASVTFTVLGVNKAGATYDPGANSQSSITIP